MTDYFTIAEKSCHCGCGLNLVDAPQNREFLDRLNRAREEYGAPMHAISMTRCPRHNANVGGAPKSAHLLGCAADIEFTSTVEGLRILAALLAAGFMRLELKPGNIHVDARPGVEPMLALKPGKTIIYL